MRNCTRWSGNFSVMTLEPKMANGTRLTPPCVAKGWRDEPCDLAAMTADAFKRAKSAERKLRRERQLLRSLYVDLAALIAKLEASHAEF